MIRYLNISLILLGWWATWGQSLLSQAPSSKMELRGVWVATLLNIDWPSQSGLGTIQQKQEINELLDLHQSQGINAIFLQVRPAADAIYPSSLEPWSQWLTGIQGQEPWPYYDPLEFWVEACHQRGMELHAWFNPFRAAVSQDLTLLSDNHVFRRQPGWFLNYGERRYFDPGLPEVREYVLGVVMDVVRRYDIDGVHFDDYFYPYKISGLEFPDSVSYRRYGNEFGEVSDWRRNNINQFVKSCRDSLNSIKPWIRFGISPFGVWRNQNTDPRGSATRAGHSNFDDLYADVLHWMREGWIDYLAPQIYWHIGYDLADYQVLLDWWSQHAYGRHIYIGQSAYKVRADADFPQWRNPGEMSDHLRLNKDYPQVQGNIYFSSRSLRQNALGLGDSLAYDHYRYPAIVPPMEYKPVTLLEAPDLYRISHGHKQLTIYWSHQHTPGDLRYHLVYRYSGQQPMDKDDASKIIARLPSDVTSFVDIPPKKGFYTYVVTTVSKTNHESPGSYALTINYRKRKPRNKKTRT